MIFLSRLLEKRFSNKCYKSIDDLPIYYWDKINEKNNLSFLVKTKNIQTEVRRFGVIRNIILDKIWRKILDEFIAKFGFSDNVKKIDSLICEIGKYKIERLANDDRTVSVLISIAEEEIEEMEKLNSKTKNNIYELKGILDRNGFHVDTIRTSVAEFYTHYFSLKSENVRRANKEK